MSDEILAGVLLAGLGMMLARRRRWRSVVDGEGRTWKIAHGYDDSEDVVMLLREMNDRTIRLLDVLGRKYHVNEDMDRIMLEGDEHARSVASERHRMATFLLYNYNPEVIVENDPRRSADTSYTVGKGRTIYFCIRSRATGELIDINTLMFTVLHEIAHIANYQGWNHESRFWSVFKWILDEAVQAGVYAPIDYRLNPVDFCGLSIAYQPLYDRYLDSA